MYEVEVDHLASVFSALALYDPRKAKMCVCVGDEDAWSKPVGMDVWMDVCHAMVWCCMIPGG